MTLQPLTVVKLGGSHAFSVRLPQAVTAIAAARAPVVIVPGGGPFADAVRAAQGRMGFSDETAHCMALLAMCQYGEVLASLHERLRPANGLARIRELLAAGTIPVWMPWPLADGLDTLHPSWDVTSDSLAVWLAARLGARRLILVKSAELPGGPASAEHLVSIGATDPAFPAYLAAGGLSALWFGPAAIPHLTCAIDSTCDYGDQIVITTNATTDEKLRS
jgi:5-(aminomethyl)-3-furanmethanol phosphate kinase